jgi:2-amino-4-hydroxy-6-hydroxymethyldihydropteridine diphosphokinase
VEGRAFGYLLGLGANLGPVRLNLAAATRQLESLGRIKWVSSLYLTAPRDFADQPDFLNAALLLETDLEPVTLLAALKGIEALLGRDPNGERYGPRVIDLDILVIPGRCLALPDITVPHPKLHERRFVLEPLAELDPDLRPWAGCDDLREDVTVSDLLELVEDQEVRRIEGPSWAGIIGPG